MADLVGDVGFLALLDLQDEEVPCQLYLDNARLDKHELLNHPHVGHDLQLIKLNLLFLALLDVPYVACVVPTHRSSNLFKVAKHVFGLAFP